MPKPAEDPRKPVAGAATGLLEAPDPLRESPDEVAVRPPRVEQRDPSYWAAEARVVYRGNLATKSQYLRGSVRKLVDPGDPEGQRVLWVPSNEGAATYDFASHDTLGRPILERRTHDNRPFAIVRHIGHLAWFVNALGPDGSHEYEVRGTPDVVARIQDYVRLQRETERRQSDSGRSVLTDMGMA